VLKVGDLQYASPATVSRAGMVYVDPKNLGYQPYMDKWIQAKSKADQDFLQRMCEKYVHGLLRLITEGMSGLQTVEPFRMIIPQTGLNMVTTRLTIDLRAIIIVVAIKFVLLHLQKISREKKMKVLST